MMIRPLSASPWDQYDLFHFREHLAAVTRHIASEQDGREHSHHRERSSRLGVRWGILNAALSGPDGPLLQLPERLDMLRSDTVGDEPSGGYPERKPLRPADRLRQHDHLVKGRGQSYLLFRRQGHRVEHIPLLEADTGYPHPVTLERATDTCTRGVQLDGGELLSTSPQKKDSEFMLDTKSYDAGERWAVLVTEKPCERR